MAKQNGCYGRGQNDLAKRLLIILPQNGGSVIGKIYFVNFRRIMIDKIVEGLANQIGGVIQLKLLYLRRVLVEIFALVVIAITATRPAQQ